jgi:hypothetical protein
MYSFKDGFKETDFTKMKEEGNVKKAFEGHCKKNFVVERGPCNRRYTNQKHRKKCDWSLWDVENRWQRCIHIHHHMKLGRETWTKHLVDLPHIGVPHGRRGCDHCDEDIPPQVDAPDCCTGTGRRRRLNSTSTTSEKAPGNDRVMRRLSDLEKRFSMEALEKM